MCLLVPQMDMSSMEEVAEIGRRPNSIPISCQLKLNMDGLLERIWEMMALVRRGRETHVTQQHLPVWQKR